jgi:hypothetical protein
MPKPPKPNVPPPPPTIDDARKNQDAADLMRTRKGRAATFVSDAAGRAAGGVGTKTLMGQGG